MFFSTWSTLKGKPNGEKNNEIPHYWSVEWQWTYLFHRLHLCVVNQWSHLDLRAPCEFLDEVHTAT